MSSLKTWLEQHGLVKYLQIFEDENITLEVLPMLQAEDLRELGLTVGHRRIFLQAISNNDKRQPAATDDDIKLVEAERRQLTVMFIDLVGSTALTEQFDPEEMADLLRQYNHAVEQQIEQHGGYIARYMGDGMLVYFGWPKAREDDAHQSVIAGLAIVSEVGNIVDIGGSKLNARVGIDSGLVVVGEIIGQGISQEKAVVGDAPNRAARLQSLAKPGEVVIGPHTRTRLGDAFEFESLKPQTLKGIKHQVEPWRVLRKRTDINRFQARSGRRIAPLVGRHSELDAFRVAIDRQSFHGFFVSGEAGVGKSRLIHEVDGFYADSPIYKVHYQCSQNHSNTFMHPVVEQLIHDLQIENSDDALSTIKQKWYLPCEHSDDHIDVVGKLLELTSPASSEATQSPQRQRKRTLEVLVENCRARSALQPCLVIFEDLQWADSSTLELINIFFQTVSTGNIILIANYRSEFSPPEWMTQLHDSEQCSFIALNPLPTDSAIRLISKLTDGVTLPQQIIRQIVAQSDGNPLYVEELARSFLNHYRSGDYLEIPDDELGGVPSTLHDALMERLDSLNSARYIAQVGALIGREFQAGLLEEISNIDKRRLRYGLQELLGANIVELKDTTTSISTSIEATYVFRHALIQQSAYDSLLLNHRKKLHLTLANHLYREEDLTTETHMENIARHYVLAEKFDQGARCWQRASQSQFAKAAMADALSCARQGLQALENFRGGSPDYNECALALHFIRGHAAAQLFGGASKEAESSFEIAEAISVSIGNTQQLFAVNFGLFYHHWERLDNHKALPTALKMRDLADQMDTPIASLVANSAIGAINFHVGDVLEADRRLQLSYRMYQPAMHSELVRDYGFNMGLFSGVYYALSRMGRGYLAFAETLLDTCIAHADEVNHAPTTCYAKAIGLSVRLMLDKPARSIVEHCDQCIELSLSQDLPFWATFAGIIKGAALSRDGQHDRGIQLLENGIAAWQATGATVTTIWWYSLSSNAYLAKKDVNRAIQEADRAIAMSEQTQELQFLSEALLARGNALAAKGLHRLAEATLEDAIRSSRRHHNLYAELRSSVALAQLYVRRGDLTQAQQLLAPVYKAIPEHGNNTYLHTAGQILKAQQASPVSL